MKNVLFPSIKNQTKSFLCSGVVFTLALLSGGSVVSAADQILAVGIDNKFTYSQESKNYKALEPGHDLVQFYSLANPAKPKLVGSVEVDNSIIGPPTNIAITPDQKLALVANAMENKPVEGGGWKMGPSNFLTVLDLTTSPMRIVSKLELGKRPSGVSISPDGTLAIVANRSDTTISVLSIDGTKVTIVDTIEMGANITGVAITADGTRAYAAKLSEHSVAELSIDKTKNKVTYAGRDLPVGLFPWTVTASSDGKRVMVTNIGNKGFASDGNNKTVSVIDLTATPPIVSQHITVGDAPEGIAISPDSSLVAVTLLGGSFAVPKDAWWYNEVGEVTLMRIKGKTVTPTDTIKVGSFPEGIAFSADNKYVYVGNFGSSTMSVIPVNEDGTFGTSTEIKLPGTPGSMRVSGQ